MKDKWYQQCGNDGDVVLSTRIRLARDLAHLPFPYAMTAEQRQEVVRQIFDILPAGDRPAFETIRMSDLTQAKALSLVERHLISPEFARCADGEALLLSADESVSMMINEEDHLRIQVMRAGLQPDEAYTEANNWDTFLDTRLHFAFDERLGYLTQCPSNLGTGMRASVMLHLPALQERGIVQQLSSTVSKLGLTIRGLYGEGSRPEGAIYQLSNQVTLGITETEAIDNLKSITAQILKEERHHREELAKTPAFEDRVFRSYGILKNARLLSSKEFMSLISNVRVGVALGMIDTVDLKTIGELLIDAQAATLIVDAGKELEPEARDQRRAELVRTRL